MIVSDLEYLQAVVDSNEIFGALGVAAGGSVSAEYGSGSAGAYALALGSQTSAITNTGVTTSLYPSFSITQARSRAGASTVSSSGSASASFLGSAYYSGNSGLSATVTSTSSRYTYSPSL